MVAGFVGLLLGNGVIRLYRLEVRVYLLCLGVLDLVCCTCFDVTLFVC